MSIKILDCTLRDGGYINDWSFSNYQIENILNCLSKSKCDIIECGYLDDKKGKKENSTLFFEMKFLNNLLNKLEVKADKVVMINFGDYDVNNLPHKNKTHIDGIRLAFHKIKFNEALILGQKIIDLGYKLYFQPMITKNFKDLEFLKVIDKVNQLNPHAFYIVDSFGSMSLEEFNKYLVLSNSNLNKNISLGYHSHNNMQLAFSNAVGMCTSNIKRDIIIDSSIYGIGRGAGNLNTELIADYLNKTFDKEYDTLPLLEIIDEFLISLMNKSPWGFSPAQFLSASFDCHPNYATYLINKNTNHIVGVRKVLEQLPIDKKSSFDKNIIDKLYINSVIEEKTSIKSNFEFTLNKKIVLLGSGPSIKEYEDLINEKINDDKYIIIALNHIPEFKCNYYFFTNQKRFDEFSSQLEKQTTIITNNIAVKSNFTNILDFKSLAFVENKLVTNVASVMINFLILKNIKNVEVVGLDGYKINQNNYNYQETSMITDYKALLEENKIFGDALNSLQNNINIDFLTPSIFKDVNSYKIIGVIPARYQSSRYEGKPLCMINNMPMIKRTYLQAKKSHLLDDIVVATESNKIKTYCESENIPVIMTSENCLTGTDRIAEVSLTKHYDLYVNIQGDEPVIDPQSIDEVVSEFKKYGDKYIAYNLYKVISEKDEIQGNTIIKTIVNEKDELMYMSRLGVPFNKSKEEAEYKKQVCVYGFTKNALKVFSSRDKTLNEQYEDIEILRFLDMGYNVKMKETTVDSIAVDIPSDVQKVEKFLNKMGLD